MAKKKKTTKRIMKHETLNIVAPELLALMMKKAALRWPVMSLARTGKAVIAEWIDNQS